MAAATDSDESSKTAAIDGDLLDDLESLLWDHVGPENSITSTEVSDELGIKDSNGNPKTREAIKIVLRERGVPVIAGANGYYIAETEKQVRDELDSLDQRIQGIEERKQLIRRGVQAAV